MTDDEVLALHRGLVAIPSPSGHEDAIATFVAGFLRGRGVDAERQGNNVIAVTGTGPTLLLNTHLDTVPASQAWTFPPHAATVRDGRVYGLGSNDAKGCVAAMVAAFLRLRETPSVSLRVALTLAAEEETGCRGTEQLVPVLSARGIVPRAVVVGEPTGLDVAVAQKGLLVLEIVSRSRTCHAANARFLGAENPILGLSKDLVAVSSIDWGADHPDLGPVTIEPTVLSGGVARNMVPEEARCILDARVNPSPSVDEMVQRLRDVVEGEVVVRSRRLRPCEVPRESDIVRAALEARPTSRTIGSRGVSDLVHFRDVPGIKVGPGDTTRSHTPDEYVLEGEVLEGALFYERVARAFAAGAAREPTP